MSPLEGSRRRNPAVPTPRYFPDPIKKDRLLCGLGRNPGWDRSHQRARGNRRLRSARHASPWYFSDPIKKGGPDDSLGWFGGLFRRLPEGPSPAAPEIEYGHSIQHTRAARMRGTAAPHGGGECARKRRRSPLRTQTPNAHDATGRTGLASGRRPATQASRTQGPGFSNAEKST